MHDEAADMEHEVQWLKTRISAMHEVIRNLRAENDDLRKRFGLIPHEHEEI